MSASRTAAVALLILLSGALVTATGENYPRKSVGPVNLGVSKPPVIPNSLAFRITLSRSLASPAVPRQFNLVPPDEPLAAPKPGLPKSRTFFIPRIRVQYAKDDLCYTGRRYFYARESRDSDVTVPSGQDTCAAASKFQVKNVAPLP